jgi:type II secretory pathway pseudopilin PulG
MIKQIFAQSGQTLVETMVAIFVLVMGITAALGLANYSLNSATNITKQLIAMGLARQGMEAVKNMRDTNWLKGGTSICPDLNTDVVNSADKVCYVDWLNPSGSLGYNINTHLQGGSNEGVRLDFDTIPDEAWSMSDSNSPRYGMNYTPSPTDTMFYTQSGSAAGDSGFFRRLSMRLESSGALAASDPFPAYAPIAPYDVLNGGQATYGRLHVIVQVWWQDKGCPLVTNPSTAAFATLRCKIQLEQVFTNWKNY